jgi:transposase-like protein
MKFNAICQIYPSETDCIMQLEQIRWLGSPICPFCHEARSVPRQSEHRHHCLNCNTSFSVTAQTLFHQSHVSLRKWFCAITLVHEGYCIREIASEIGVNKNTAWLISKRIRKAMQNDVQKQILERILAKIKYMQKDI